MKRNLLLSLASLFVLSTSAQLSNSSFENWYSDTASFSFAPFVPLDTFYFTSPVNWTSGNSITMSAGLHHSQFVDSTNDAFAGNKGLYLRTDTIYIDAATLYLVIPGFVVNGNLRLQLSDVLGGTGGLNPANIGGAGVPFSIKKKGIGFHMKYFPTINDSCLIWAILKKGNQVVAEAKFNTTQTISSYTYFEKDFTYYSCDNPDTLVVLLSSSNPNFSTLGSGSTGLNRGSELYIDSVQMISFANGYNFSPITTRDVTSMIWNTSKTISVLANDSDCENDPLAVSISTNPIHGAASLNLNNEIVYTPNINYSGKDSLKYSLSDGHTVSLATVEITIFSISGINDLTTNSFSVFPNPSSSFITVQSFANEPLRVQLINLNGEVIQETNMSSSGSINFNTEKLNNGIYILQFVSVQSHSTLNRKIVIAR